MNKKKRGHTKLKRQLAKKQQRGRGQAPSTPQARGGRIRVECAQVDASGRAKIMVSRYTHERVLTQPRHAFVGLGAVPHHVAKHPDTVESTAKPRVLQHRVQGTEIRVNIRQKKASPHPMAL
jgi:hypothetical protein